MRLSGYAVRYVASKEGSSGFVSILVLAASRVLSFFLFFCPSCPRRGVVSLLVRGREERGGGSSLVGRSYVANLGSLVRTLLRRLRIHLHLLLAGPGRPSVGGVSERKRPCSSSERIADYRVALLSFTAHLPPGVIYRVPMRDKRISEFPSFSAHLRGRVVRDGSRLIAWTASVARVCLTGAGAMQRTEIF